MEISESFFLRKGFVLKLISGLFNKLCQNKFKTCRPAGGLQK